MKDWNFIERLSAYLDGELPREQVAALEEELRGDPVKMRMYRDYLRLDRGSEVLCRAISAQAERPQFPSDSKVIWVPRTLEPRRSVFPAWGMQALAGSAAAAVALTVGVFAWSGKDRVPVAEQAAVRTSVPQAPENVYVISDGGLSRLAGRSNGAREHLRRDSWGRLVRMEVATELPNVPSGVQAAAYLSGNVALSEVPLSPMGSGGYHGNRAGSRILATPAFAGYEFQR